MQMSKAMDAKTVKSVYNVWHTVPHKQCPINEGSTYCSEDPTITCSMWVSLQESSPFPHKGSLALQPRLYVHLHLRTHT